MIMSFSAWIRKKQVNRIKNRIFLIKKELKAITFNLPTNPVKRHFLCRKIQNIVNGSLYAVEAHLYDFIDHGFKRSRNCSCYTPKYCSYKSWRYAKNLLFLMEEDLGRIEKEVGEFR